MNNKISIIVSNYNGASINYKGKSILYNCLNSLKTTKYNNYNIIIADAHSNDNSEEVAKKFNVDWIQTENRSSYSENNNNAIKYTKKKYNPDYYLLLNNDIINPNYYLLLNKDIIITDENWLSNLINAENKQIPSIVGCQLLYPNYTIQHAGVILGYYGARNRGRNESVSNQYNKIEEMEGITFAVALINKKIIEKIGLLDERFNMGFEDIDYCVRTKEAGFKIIYNGKVNLIHLEGQSSTNSKSKKTQNKYFYLGQQNFIRFMKKHKKIYPLKIWLKGMTIFFIGSIITIESNNHSRSILNIRFRKNAFHNLYISFKVFIYNIK